MLSKTRLSNKIYQSLESTMIARLKAANATDESLRHAKRDMRDLANAVANSVVEEINANAVVRMYKDVRVLKSALQTLMQAIVSSPVVPMDGGASMKIAIATKIAGPMGQVGSTLLEEKVD